MSKIAYTQSDYRLQYALEELRKFAKQHIAYGQERTVYNDNHSEIILDYIQHLEAKVVKLEKELADGTR